MPLQCGSLELLTADIGADNPLPPVAQGPDLPGVVPAPGADAEMVRNLAYGKVPTVLPYLMQDGYSRERQLRRHRTAVLDNEFLRATFLTDMGGRLWSLYDKQSGRELLSRNPVVQPANLALRNAWLAGGVEWNLGTTGHWPLTCSPLHVARVERSDGVTGLRLYEYERMRGLVMRIDATLPAGARALIVKVTIRNPRDETVPIYWWSNIAVPQADDVRVVVPAQEAWHFGYTGELGKVSFPGDERGDLSYPAHAPNSNDYFFELDQQSDDAAAHPWIAVVDGSGSGMFQASTRRLRGRKLFEWGSGAGGGHWQEWLSDGRSRYLEVQAGLARTQMEHVPLAAGGTWSWTEAYGPVSADATRVHGAWARAIEEVGSAIGASAACVLLDSELARDESRDRAHAVSWASGWGALEDLLRAQNGRSPLSEPRTPFPAETMGPEQDYWRDLLGTSSSGACGPDVSVAPPSYQIGGEWLPALERRDDWLSHLHRGVILAAAGDIAAACAAWRTSIERTDNAWAHRNLGAVLAAQNDAQNDAQAGSEYDAALELLPDEPHLIAETLRFRTRVGQSRRALELIDGIRGPLRVAGRTLFAEASAALAVGDIDRCGKILDAGFEIVDVREGELSLDRLWIDYQAARIIAATGAEIDDGQRRELESSVPKRYDFRQHIDAG